MAAVLSRAVSRPPSRVVRPTATTRWPGDAVVRTGLVLRRTAGAATPHQLRRSGFLTGGDAGTDEVLSAATAGPAPTLHDYF
ncbi:hypothetical protein GCM10009557_91510 [Virgisporangium ochraceum]